MFLKIHPSIFAFFDILICVTFCHSCHASCCVTKFTFSFLNLEFLQYRHILFITAISCNFSLYVLGDLQWTIALNCRFGNLPISLDLLLLSELLSVRVRKNLFTDAKVPIFQVLLLKCLLFKSWFKKLTSWQKNCLSWIKI